MVMQVPAHGRQVEHASYRYLLRSGKVQTVTAMVHVSRQTWRLRWLRGLPPFPLGTRVRHYIDVQFSDEIGEGSGSWKGGGAGGEAFSRQTYDVDMDRIRTLAGQYARWRL